MNKRNNNQNLPLITIITVVYNGDKYIEKTIQSIITQDYNNIEYIIIDGNSTDNTINIIKKYEDKIDYWISEPDKGIYDAMNKGIDLASGDWINFMNAGDIFYDSNTIKDIFSNNIYKKIDIIYGDVVIDYGKFKRKVYAEDLAFFWKGMTFSHQSSFIKNSYHKKNKYSLNYKIAGDFDFFLNSLNKGANFYYSNRFISIMDIEGLSDGNRLTSIYQNHLIINKHSFSIKRNAYYLFLYVDQLIRKIMKIILPQKVVDTIKSNKSSNH